MHYRSPPGKKRTAFVGDSFTAGYSADKIERRFVGVFDSMLHDKNIEVLNFGVCGYGLAEEELLIKEEVIKSHPDYVFLMVFNGNDFRDTYLGINHYIISGGVLVENVSLYEEKVPRELIPDEVRKKRFHDSRSEQQSMKKACLNERMNFKDYLKDHYATFRFLSRLKNRIFSRPMAAARPDLTTSYNCSSNLDKEFHESRKDVTSHLFWSQIPYPDIAVRSRDITLKTLGNISEYLKTEHLKLIIITIPYAAQVYTDKESTAEYDVHLPQKYIEMFARNHNIPYMDLLPELREYVQKNNIALYVEGDIHWNNTGHRLVGELLNKWVRNGLIDSQYSFYKKRDGTSDY